MKQRHRNSPKVAAPSRKLQDLVSVGPAAERDLHALGVRTVRQLARSRPLALYEKVSRVRRKWQDPCVLDVFTAAVEQARHPMLPAEKCQWWYWSRRRLRNRAR